MYVRPRSIFEKFLVEEKVTRIADDGRTAVEFKATGAEILGVVNSISPHEVEKWHKLGHDVDCVIVQHCGAIKADVGDCLVKGERKYLVKAIENPAGVSQFYLYFCQGRWDI